MKKVLCCLLLLIFEVSCSKESISPSPTNPSVSPNPTPISENFNYPKSTSKKNYLISSYNLSKYDYWINSNDIISNGAKYTKDNPLQVIQTTQLDINMDGFEDIFTYDSYPLNIPTPNPPPSIFLGDGNKFTKTTWSGPELKNPHGTKLLIGDFNSDSYPDIFSLVAVDPPNGAFPALNDFCNILFNSPTGFKEKKEFSDQLGFWYTGCSGDIDSDGDLDIIMFNFHVNGNGVKNKILWNDGKGIFTFDSEGIGLIPIVDQAELVDINADGFIDLIIDHIDVSQNSRMPKIEVLFGNGKGFKWIDNPMISFTENQFINSLNFADLDNDLIQEIIVSGFDDKISKYWIRIYKSDDKGKTFVELTSKWIDVNLISKRFDKLRIQDIDKNGKLDIISSDKADNIRWEWNGSKFILQ